MKKTAIILVVSSFLTSLLLLSCSSVCSDLRDKVKDFAKNDSQIDAKECAALKKYITENAEDCIKCHKKNPLVVNGTVSESALIDFINSVLIKSGPIKITCSEAPVPTILPKLYLERSGSMVSYHKQSMKSDFKNILETFLNNFDRVNPNQNKIFVVNDAVYPSPLDFSGLINSPNIFAATNLGDARYTDFRGIFSNIFDELKEGEVSMLFSDLIYSTKAMQVTNNEQVLTEAMHLTESVFHGYSQNNSMMVLKFHADYDGEYYPFNGGKFTYRGDRPFYVCLFAKNATMKAFLSNQKYEQIRDWTRYTNFENFHLFTNDQSIKTPFYTISLNKADKIGQFRQSNEELKQKPDYIHALQDVEYSRENKLGIQVLIDLSNLYMPENLKTDKGNYLIEETTAEGFSIDKIIPVSGIDNATHRIFLSAKNPPKKSDLREVKISLRKTFPPAWIAASQAETDVSAATPNFSTTTFGIKNMLTGIDNAYNLTNEPNHFTINIQLKK